MTITVKQMRAAGRELRRRREGEVEKQADRASSTRPFGAATDATLARFASGPTANEVDGMKQELALRAAGAARRKNRGPNTARPFEQAQTSTLRAHVQRDE